MELLSAVFLLFLVFSGTSADDPTVDVTVTTPSGAATIRGNLNSMGKQLY